MDIDLVLLTNTAFLYIIGYKNMQSQPLIVVADQFLGFLDTRMFYNCEVIMVINNLLTEFSI